MRRLDSGAVVEVDAILQALFLLSELAPDRREDGKRLDPSGGRRGVISRGLSRVGPSPGGNDNDDDPPPRRVSGCCFVPPLSKPMGKSA